MNKFASSSSTNLRKFQQPTFSYSHTTNQNNLQLDPLFSKRSDQLSSNRLEFHYNIDKIDSQRNLIIGDYIFTRNEPSNRKIDPLEISAISSEPSNNITIKAMGKGEFLEERGSDFKSIDPADFEFEPTGINENMIGQNILPPNLLSPAQASLTMNLSPLGSPNSVFKFNMNPKPSQQSTKRNSGAVQNDPWSDIFIEDHEVPKNLDDSSETSFLQIMTCLSSQENIPSTPRESLHRVHVEKYLEPHKAYFQREKKSKPIWTKKIFAPIEDNVIPWPSPSPTMTYSVSDNRISVGSSVVQFEVQNRQKKRTSSDINLAYGSFGPSTDTRRALDNQIEKTPPRIRGKFKMNGKQLITLIGRTASVGRLRTNTLETPDTQASTNTVKTKGNSPYFNSSPDKDRENEDPSLHQTKKNTDFETFVRAETFGEYKGTEESPSKNLMNLFKDPTTEKYSQGLDPLSMMEFNSKIHEQLEILEELNKELDHSYPEEFQSYDLLKTYLEVLIQRTYDILMNNTSLAKLKIDNRSLHAIKDLVSQLQFSKFVHKMMRALGLLYPICCEKEVTLEQQRAVQGIKSTPTRPPRRRGSGETSKIKRTIPKLPLEKLPVNSNKKEEATPFKPTQIKFDKPPLDSPTDLYVGSDSATSSVPREYASATQYFERLVDDCKNELPLGHPGLNITAEEIFGNALTMDIPKYLWKQFIEKTFMGMRSDITTTGAKSSTRSSRRNFDYQY